MGRATGRLPPAQEQPLLPATGTDGSCCPAVGLARLPVCRGGSLPPALLCSHSNGLGCSKAALEQNRGAVLGVWELPAAARSRPQDPAASRGRSFQDSRCSRAALCSPVPLSPLCWCLCKLPCTCASPRELPALGMMLPTGADSCGLVSLAACHWRASSHHPLFSLPARKHQFSPQSKSSSKVTSVPGKASKPGPTGAKVGKSRALSPRKELLNQLKDSIPHKRAKILGKV